MLKTLILSSCFFFFSSCIPIENEKLTIAAAANMQFTLEALVTAFSQQTGIPCETVISSSGKLTAQIQQGAPLDVFISADMKYPMELYHKGYTSAEPEVYARGLLVLWSLVPGITPSLEVLTDSLVRHIALPNPQTAPYGEAAMEVMRDLNILDEVSGKLVYGESIAQTNQFILSGSAEIGFTAQSVVLSPQMKDRGQWQALDTTFYNPIAQGIVIIINRQLRQVEARKFYEFVLSNPGREILEKFGYLTNRNRDRESEAVTDKDETPDLKGN